MTTKAKPIPYKNVCDVVFKKDLLPAVYRWVSSLPPEELERFDGTFTRLLKEGKDESPAYTRKLEDRQLQASRYTVPEWNSFGVKLEQTKHEITMDDLLNVPTSSHITYGAFTEEEMKTAKAIPTRTRANDVSQINATTRSKAYMERWAERMMNTSYRADTCKSNFKRTIKDQTKDQIIIVYSKNTLSEIAHERAKLYADNDQIWTRNFREMCRSLANAIDSTEYRTGYTSLKEVNKERFANPKWTDPIPVSRGMKKPAESFWESTAKSTFIEPDKTSETYKVRDQHRACYTRPFDLFPMTEKTTTSFRDDYLDHMKNKDDQPEYWVDMRVKMPSGSGVVGDVIGDGNIP